MAQSTVSHSLQGHVYDIETELPLQAAKITVLGSRVFSYSESESGYFNITDIPTEAVRNNQIELLITKEGYAPKTMTEQLTNDRRSSIFLTPTETLSQKWFKKLKESNEGKPEIIIEIANFAVESPRLKNEVIDILIQIKTSTDFDFSKQEEDVASKCLKKVRKGEISDEEIIVQVTREKINLGEMDGDHSTEEELRAAFVYHLLYTSRSSEESSDVISNLFSSILLGSQLIVDKITNPNLNNLLSVGDEILSYEGADLFSIDDLNTKVRENQNKRLVVLRIKTADGGIKDIEIPGGELGFSIIEKPLLNEEEIDKINKEKNE